MGIHNNTVGGYRGDTQQHCGGGTGEIHNNTVGGTGEIHNNTVGGYKGDTQQHCGGGYRGDT